MSATIIDGRRIAAEIKREVLAELDQLKSIYKTNPSIASVMIGKDESSKLYLRLRDKACSDIGIQTTQHILPEDTTEREIHGLIEELNNDSEIHGILLQLPLPKHLSLHRILSKINPLKDVEGVTPYNIGTLITGEERIIPCTPMAVLKILQHMEIPIEGSNIVIINHSHIVGKPLATIMLNRNATVTICHIYTKNIKDYTVKADILVTATGVPGLITEDYIKEGACVIDVGITKTSDGVKGDVDFETVKEKAGFLTPVPGGVGPVTIACSLLNMVKTFKLCMEMKK